MSLSMSATLAQTLADRYHLDIAEVDRILHTDDDCGQGWEGQKGHCVRSKVLHGAEHLTESAAGWAVGKFVGGAIAQVAASHGFPPGAAHLISETAVQAIAATLIHARKAENRNPTELAAKFLTEAAAGAIGKSSHSGAHTALEHIEGSAHAKAFGAIIAGKAGGISTAVAVSDLAHRYAERLTKQGKALHALVTARVPVSRTDADSGTADQLTREERSALFDLTMAGWAIARKLKIQPKQDAMPTALDDRLTLAKLIGEELQSPGLYGAPIRIRKFNVEGKTVTGEFVGTEDGRSYSFTYANGKVNYQPAVAKLDSESVNQFTVRWDSHTEALEAKVSNPVRMDATGKRLKCGSATYQCGGVCQGVHRQCHKNEKAAVDHGRINKINDLIDHLNNGGEHPLKGLGKPDVAKLQATATQIQSTRDLRAQNLQAALPGTGSKRRLGSGEAIASAQNSIKEAAISTGAAAVAQREFMGTAMQMAKEGQTEASRSKIGDRIRAQAQALRESNETTKKAVAGILGATAKMAGNHDRLIDEVAEMANADLGVKPGENRASVGKQSDRTIPVSAIESKPLPKGAGDRLRAITGELRKANAETKRGIVGILGAAAQISQNHENLIDEAAAMANEDLDKQAKRKSATQGSTIAQRHATNVQALQGKKEGSAKEQPFTSAASKEGVKPKTVNGVKLSTKTPTELKAMGHDGADEIHRRMAFEGHNMSVAQFKDHELNRARARHGGYLQDRMNAPRSEDEKHQRNVDDIEQVILGHIGSKGDRKLKEAHRRRVENAIESGELTVAKAKKLGHFQTHPDLAAKYAPLAAQARSRTAGDLGATGKYRHVSLDAIAGAIGRLRDRGIRIDAKAAVAMLKDAEDCGCEECQHKRKRKPQVSDRVDSRAFPDKEAHAQAVREAKAKFKVFPSRYAGMWLTQRYQELVKAKRQKVGAK